MRIIPDKFPANIPHIFASFVSAIFISYSGTSLILEMFTGRPSSTSSIGIVLIPIITLILFLVCFVVGSLVSNLIEKYLGERVVSAKTIRTIYILFVVTVLASSVAGGVSFKRYEDSQKPRVISNSTTVEKIRDVNYQKSNQVEAKLLLTVFDDEKNRLSTMIWHDIPLRFHLERNTNSLALLDNKGKQLTLIDLSGFDYITRVYAVPLIVDKTNRKGLAVLVHLRITSWRSVLLIYNAEMALIYKELLNRESTDNVMKVVKDASGKEYLWLNADTPIIYSVKVGGRRD